MILKLLFCVSVSILILWAFSHLFVFVDNLVDDLIGFIKYKLLKHKPRERRRSVTNAFEPNSPAREAYLSVFRFFYQITQAPSDLKYEVRQKYQRAIRGWSVSDVWGFNFYLTRVILGGLNWLKKNKHGCPILKGFGTTAHRNQTDEEFKAMMKEWDSILDSMIWTFEMAKKINEDNYYVQKSKNYSQKRADKFNKIWIDYTEDIPRALTYTECKRYEQGWSYFQEHFFSLWD